MRQRHSETPRHLQLEPSQRQPGKLLKRTPPFPPTPGGKASSGRLSTRCQREGDRVPNGCAPPLRAGQDLPSRPEGEEKGRGARSGSARTGGPLTLTAVLFAIVRAHPAAVMPAASRDTPSLGRTARALRPRKARPPGPLAAHTPRSRAEVRLGAAPALLQWEGALGPLLAPPMVPGGAGGSRRRS